MNIYDLLKWQHEIPQFRHISLKIDANCEFKSKYTQSVLLFEYKHDNIEKRRVLFPLELLASINTLDDFKVIEEKVKEYNENREKVISPWLYPKEKFGFNLKGHYFALKTVGICELFKISKDKNFDDYFKNKTRKFFDKIEKVINVNDINDNNMKYFDYFYKELELFYEDLRNHLKINYGYVE